MMKSAACKLKYVSYAKSAVLAENKSYIARMKYGLSVPPLFRLPPHYANASAFSEVTPEFQTQTGSGLPPTPKRTALSLSPDAPVTACFDAVPAITPSSASLETIYVAAREFMKKSLR